MPRELPVISAFAISGRDLRGTDRVHRRLDLGPDRIEREVQHTGDRRDGREGGSRDPTRLDLAQSLG